MHCMRVMNEKLHAEISLRRDFRFNFPERHTYTPSDRAGKQELLFSFFFLTGLRISSALAGDGWRRHNVGSSQ
jgi:hypothetical protein